MTKLTTLLMALICLSCTSFADPGWQETNNGGEGLVCTDSVSGGVYLAMEYVEMQMRYKLTPKLEEIQQYQDEREVAKELVRRLPTMAQHISARAEYMIDRFYDEAQFVSFPENYSTNDGGTYRGLPEHCSFIQFANFVHSWKQMKTRPYHLNKDVWPWLHTTQKGIVITHEVLYRIAIGMTGGPPTSEDIRLVVALLIADRIQEAPRSYAARALNHAFLWVDRDMPHLLAD